MRAAFLTAIISAFLLSAVAWSQLPPGNWWENEDMKKALQLSDEQLEKIKSIAAEGQKQMEEQRQKYGEKSKEMRDAMSDVEKLQGMTDEQIDKLLDEIQGMRNRMEKARFVTTVKTLKVLTKEQALKLSEKQKEMREEMVEKFRQKQPPQAPKAEPPVKPEKGKK